MIGQAAVVQGNLTQLTSDPRAGDCKPDHPDHGRDIQNGTKRMGDKRRREKRN